MGTDAGLPCTLPSSIVTLASLPQNGGDLTGAIALDATYVYWIYDGMLGDAEGSLLRVPKCGGDVVTLTTSVSPFPYNTVAVDGTSAYWTNPSADETGTVIRVPVQGGASVTLDMGGDPIGVAVDNEYVYWADTQGDALFRVPKTGGAPTMLTTGAALYFLIAVDATSVYTIAGDGTGAGSVVRIPILGGPAMMLASGFPTGLAVDDTNVYWMNDPSTNGMTPPGNATVLSVPKVGGTPATIAANRVNPTGIAVDESRVYWIEQPSSASPVPNVLSAPK